MTIFDLPGILRKTWPQSEVSGKIIKGFEVIGIYPFNRNIFTDVEYAPSFVSDRPNPSSTADEETTGTNPSSRSSNTTGADEIASLPVASTSQDDGHPQKSNNASVPFLNTALFRLLLLRTISSAKFSRSKTNLYGLPFVYQNTSALSCCMTPLAFHM